MTDQLEKAIDLYLKKAKEVEEDAGYAGAMDDGGAGRMRNQVQTYKDGLHGVVPQWLLPYLDQVIAEEDPEYKDYLRLKAKFEKK